MMTDVDIEREGRKADEQGLLFDYTVKLLLLAGFLELVLYRLVSRLGMHLSKLAQKYEWVRVTFRWLSSIGFTLLNFVSLLLFLAISVFLFNKIRSMRDRSLDRLLVPLMSLLVALTITFLLFPSAMIGSVVYNLISFAVLLVIVIEYMMTHALWQQRLMVGCFSLGVTGWLYYQTLSTTYGLLGIVTPAPLVHEINRIGEALMVLASVLVFWAYGGTPLRTTNKRQQRRAVIFLVTGASIFLLLLFLDFILVGYDPSVAESVRKAGEGIGWIFQMGMGYTFYLPFAFYVTGLICWAYTVIKLITIRRLAGYGLGLMFMAGYALQLSHLTLMLVFGLLLLNLDRKRIMAPLRESVGMPVVQAPAAALIEERV